MGAARITKRSWVGGAPREPENFLGSPEPLRQPWAHWGSLKNTEKLRRHAEVHWGSHGDTEAAWLGTQKNTLVKLWQFQCVGHWDSWTGGDAGGVEAGEALRPQRSGPKAARVGVGGIPKWGTLRQWGEALGSGEWHQGSWRALA